MCRRPKFLKDLFPDMDKPEGDNPIETMTTERSAAAASFHKRLFELLCCDVITFSRDTCSVATPSL